MLSQTPAAIRARKYYAANREKYARYGRRWYAANKEKLRVQRRARYLRDREKMLARSRRQYANDMAQGIRRRKGLPKATHKPTKRCECCGIKPKRRLCFDHCHKTKQFRGWLCSPCNVGLGMFKDSPSVLKKAISYLQRGARG